MREDVLQLVPAGRRSWAEYLAMRVVKTGNKDFDEILEGGTETGNYYLFLGSAKNGKSTILRCLGMSMAKQGYPVLYCNFEQPGKNTFAKIFSMLYNKDFRPQTHTSDADKADTLMKVERMPSIPFYVAFWVKELENNAFNLVVKDLLAASVARCVEDDPEHRKPLVILENLTDIYNERLDGRDSLVNIVTQTAQDIKQFAMNNDLTIFLATHAMKTQGEEPTLDDVRDSKRVVDLAHSIFAAFLEVDEAPDGTMIYNYCFKYLAGRNSSQPKKWRVEIDGLTLKLLPYIPPLKVSKKRRA
jgi:hypothetical protein